MLSEYKLILKDCILYDSISITFLKWENYRNRTHGLRWWEQKRSGCTTKGHNVGFLPSWKRSLPGLYQCQCPDGELYQVLRDVTIGWKLDKACIGTLCIISYNHVSLYFKVSNLMKYNGEMFSKINKQNMTFIFSKHQLIL